jgi:hypothetical protein
MPAEAFSDLWICSNCGAENHNWCTECPLCGHAKDNAQAPNDYDDLWICPECGAENCGWCDHCPLCEYVKSEDAYVNSAEGMVQVGAGEPAPGVWVCVHCGSSNASFHWNQCGACGKEN